jgi:hypothetical protein
VGTKCPHKNIEIDERGSEAMSDSSSSALVSTASEAEAKILDSITALAAGPLHDLYCTGNSEGVVEIFDTTGLKILELQNSHNFMPVTHIGWDQTGRHFLWRDLGGKVVVCSLGPGSPATKGTRWSARQVLDTTIKAEAGGTLQLLLNPTSTHLLITGPTSAQVWSVQSGLLLASWMSKKPGTYFRWMNHPIYQDQLLAFSVGGGLVLRWSDLVEISAMKFDLGKSRSLSVDADEELGRIRRPSAPASISPMESSAVVDKVMLTQDSAHIIIETMEVSGQQLRGRQIMIFEKSAFDNSSSTLTPMFLPTNILDRVQLPLGILAGNKFVFLDNNHWLCVWRLGSGSNQSSVERHYFLPRDWLNAESLEMCLLMENGTFLMPKDGEVAIVKSDLSLQW